MSPFSPLIDTPPHTAHFSLTLARPLTLVGCHPGGGGDDIQPGLRVSKEVLPDTDPSHHRPGQAFMGTNTILYYIYKYYILFRWGQGDCILPRLFSPTTAPARPQPGMEPDLLLVLPPRRLLRPSSLRLEHHSGPPRIGWLPLGMNPDGVFFAMHKSAQSVKKFERVRKNYPRNKLFFAPRFDV